MDRAGFKRHWVAHVIIVQQQLSILASKHLRLNVHPHDVHRSSIHMGCSENPSSPAFRRVGFGDWPHSDGGLVVEEECRRGGARDAGPDQARGQRAGPCLDAAHDAAPGCATRPRRPRAAPRGRLPSSRVWPTCPRLGAWERCMRFHAAPSKGRVSYLSGRPLPWPQLGPTSAAAMQRM